MTEDQSDDEHGRKSMELAKKLLEAVDGYRLDEMHTAIAAVLARVASSMGLDEEMFRETNAAVLFAADCNFRTYQTAGTLQ